MGILQYFHMLYNSSRNHKKLKTSAASLNKSRGKVVRTHREEALDEDGFKMIDESMLQLEDPSFVQN